MDRTAIRKHRRQARRALTASQQQAAARRVAARALNLPNIRHAHHIALYLPNDGEVDLQPLIRQLWRRGQQCYLPVLSKIRSQQLVFRRYNQHTLLVSNQLGIPEPRGGKTVDVQALDVVLMPLVAFDQRGNRLGMGGGFYDRTLARPAGRPRLIGIAHACQQVDNLPRESWDVPMNAVLTDRSTVRCR